MEQEHLPIVKYGAEVLALRASELTQIDQRIVELIRRMATTMYNAPGVGLAAPQVGESIRLFTMDPSAGEHPNEFMVWINPVIAEAEGKEIHDEGCLSVPGYTLPVERATHILLRGIDPEGKPIEREFKDFAARVVQHELDHLNGVVIVDHISSLRRSIIKKEINKLKRRGEW